MDGNNFEITFFNYPLIRDVILVQSLIGRKTQTITVPLGIVKKGKKEGQSTRPVFLLGTYFGTCRKICLQLN